MAGKNHLEAHIRLNGVRVDDLGPLSLEVYRGEFIAIVNTAENLSGRLLRMIAGLLLPDSGDILIADSRVTGPRPEAGFVFQRPSLLASRTVLENVLLQVDLRRKRTVDSKHHGRELLALIGAGDVTGQWPGELTTPIAVRAAICRALIHNPAILLMDDPFRPLAPLERERLATDLQRVWLERPLTTVLSISSVQEAIQLADRVAVISAKWKNTRLLMIDLPRPRKLDKRTTPRIMEYASAVRTALEALGDIA